MRVLIDINHPGQVHLFRPLTAALRQDGAEVLMIAREKDVTLSLLEAFGLPYVRSTVRGKGLTGLLRELVAKTLQIRQIGSSFRPDLLLSLGSPPAAWAATLLGVPHVAMEDTEHSIEQALLYLPFTRHVLTSTAFERRLGARQVRYRGYHELAYLHPKRFRPDPEVPRRLGLDPTQAYSIVRFVSWQASHDVGQKGFTPSGRNAIVRTLAKAGQVVLTSEAQVPEELSRHCVHIPPQDIHHVLAFARLYIGEGATLASEAAMLGTPAIYVNSLTAGTLKEQEAYGLLHRKTDEVEAIAMAEQLLGNPKLRALYHQRRDKMLNDKIDVTAFLIDVLSAVKEGKSISEVERRWA